MPEGYEAWRERVLNQIAANPKGYKDLKDDPKSKTLSAQWPMEQVVDNWDGLITRADARPEGSNSQAQAEAKAKALNEELAVKDLEDKEGVLPKVEELEQEPPLTREQYVSSLSYKMPFRDEHERD